MIKIKKKSLDKFLIPEYCKDCSWRMIVNIKKWKHDFNWTEDPKNLYLYNDDHSICFWNISTPSKLGKISIIEKCSYKQLKYMPYIQPIDEDSSDFEDDVSNLATDVWGGAGPDCKQLPRLCGALKITQKTVFKRSPDGAEMGMILQ